MITFKEFLNEDAGDRAAQKDREWLAKKNDLIDLVDKHLNASVRTATNLNHITHAQWFSTRTVKSNNLRLAMNVLSPPLRKTAVVFHMDIRDERPLTVPSPLSKDQLPFDAVVIVEPINGDMIALPSIRQPLKSTFSSGRGAGSDASRISDIVKIATKNLTFYARNHHKAKQG